MKKIKNTMDRFWMFALGTGLILALAGPVIPERPRVLFIALGVWVLAGGFVLWLVSRFF